MSDSGSYRTAREAVSERSRGDASESTLSEFRYDPISLHGLGLSERIA
jgi:hypothetical protein